MQIAVECGGFAFRRQEMPRDGGASREERRLRRLHEQGP
jgi:hypothetical protein